MLVMLGVPAHQVRVLGRAGVVRGCRSADVAPATDDRARDGQRRCTGFLEALAAIDPKLALRSPCPVLPVARDRIRKFES